MHFRNLMKLIESWNAVLEADDGIAHDYTDIGKRLRDIEQDKQGRYGPYHGGKSGGKSGNSQSDSTKPPFHNYLTKLGFSHQYYPMSKNPMCGHTYNLLDITEQTLRMIGPSIDSLLTALDYQKLTRRKYRSPDQSYYTYTFIDNPDDEPPYSIVIETDD